jgi:maltose/moltooligosaccharide transporter
MVLDASINVSMEPFRAFVADKLNPDQRTTGFSEAELFYRHRRQRWLMLLPYLLSLRMRVTGRTSSGIPLTVQYSFKIGAAAFLGAVLWTVFTTKEYPPENMEEFEANRARHKGIWALIKSIVAEILSAIRENAKDHETIGRCPTLHLAWTLLHVAILRLNDLLPRLRRN